MSSSPQDGAVAVTAEVRPHPAFRKLARACIALARLQLEQPPDDQAADLAQLPDKEASR